MSHVTASDGLKLSYLSDDYTDPWRNSDTLVMLHAAMENAQRILTLACFASTPGMKKGGQDYSSWVTRIGARGWPLSCAKRLRTARHRSARSAGACPKCRDRPS